MKTITEDGLEISLMVEGERLQEYDDEDFTLRNTASAYIEAAEGSQFGVHIKAKRELPKTSGDSINMAVYLDGKYACSRVIDLSDWKYPYFSWTLPGIARNTSHGPVMEKFTFAHLNTTDASVANLKKEQFKDMGEIRVTCIWVRKTGYTTAKENETRFESAFGSSVPEKCLKGRAISNKASVGAPERDPNPTHGVSVSYPYGRAPFASFKFKYRSRRDLQIEGIIPRSPSPLPLEERDPDDLTPEEARELVRRLREQGQQNTPVKKEIKRENQLKRGRSDPIDVDAESDEDGVTVTSAGPARKRNRPSTDSGIECIDLTED